MRNNKTILLQYLRGEKIGQIVEAVGVDREEDMTFIELSDNSRMNAELIGSPNDVAAYQRGLVMVQIPDRNNPWTLKEDTVTAEDRMLTDDKSGQQFQTLDPYAFGKEGGESKLRNQKIMLPPKRLQAFWMRHNGQAAAGVINGVEYSNLVKEMSSLSPDQWSGSTAQFYDLEKFQTAKDLYIMVDPSTNMPTFDIKQLEGDGGGFDFDSRPAASVQPARPVIEAKPEDLDLHVQQPVIEAKPEDLDLRVQQPVRPAQVKDMSGSPVYNIVSKCKKRHVDMPLTIGLDIPGKTIYTLIKEEYEDGCLNDFFDIIINDLSIDDIRKALREALEQSYEA